MHHCSQAGSTGVPIQLARRRPVPDDSANPEMTMTESLYPPSSGAIARKRKALAPGPLDAFKAFSEQVFAPGALDRKTKELIAVAAAHITQCPYCIHGHTASALKHGASEEEIMEAIWVASEMRAGAA
ncbi:MAG: carboxymuconolactone decarboxylase family protein, partial [Rhodocyclaceae bacterium]|nr:carboxymuconolactone decarboxylase family protein [Rhodocyclaceae bacterium]